MMPSLRTVALPLTLLFLLVATLLVFLPHGLTEDAFGRMIRLTAASSLALFSLTFSASSLNHFFANGRWQPVMRARRQLGLSFALSHAVHLLAIIALVHVVFDGDYAALGDILGGSVIYAFIFAMAITSNNASVKRLGARNWRRLHKTGGYLIWVGLFSSYIGRAIETGAIHYWFFSALGVGLAGVRVWAYLDQRKSKMA